MREEELRSAESESSLWEEVDEEQNPLPVSNQLQAPPNFHPRNQRRTLRRSTHVADQLLHAPVTYLNFDVGREKVASRVLAGLVGRARKELIPFAHSCQVRHICIAGSLERRDELNYLFYPAQLDRRSEGHVQVSRGRALSANDPPAPSFSALPSPMGVSTFILSPNPDEVRLLQFVQSLEQVVKALEDGTSVLDAVQAALLLSLEELLAFVRMDAGVRVSVQLDQVMRRISEL